MAIIESEEEISFYEVKVLNKHTTYADVEIKRVILNGIEDQIYDPLKYTRCYFKPLDLDILGTLVIGATVGLIAMWNMDNSLQLIDLIETTDFL